MLRVTEDPHRWLGRAEPVRCLPRSPDLTKMAYFLWGYVKEEVYKTPPTTRANMQNRIREAFQSINHQMLRNVAG
ncbi:unnamed protein product [Acanthoscelides obtectus]|uniref:Transposase n=1 Tax=Acanthoscelides obtectus TaxID=200917 RepID=A0A9P0LUA1_ACAOB|nr:unnamed protein product [Acanthoscelides obtectus]CAK1686552.1 hypothetical protein AOBTE_LOCUS35992 [Acanthoscelides obtectus]